MAVIKFKRGSGVPTGLTAYEAAWDTSFGRFFINNGLTATWIGARIDPTTTLGGAGACAYFVPTQLAVKTYVDAQVAGGAVSSVNGLTGAVTNVAFTNQVNTFTQSQIIQGSASTFKVEDSSSSDYVLIDPNSNSVIFYDNATASLATLSATGAFANQTVKLPSQSGTLALRDVAQSFTGLQNFTTGISASTVNSLTIGLGAGNVSTNFAVGTNALDATTVGQHNIAIGFSSLTNVTSTGVTDCIALGNQALRDTTTGGSNIALGSGSLLNNTTGVGNIGLGVNALQSNTVENSNTAIGSSSLGNIIGTQNVALGADAGRYSGTGAFTSLISGTGGIYIGFGARGSGNTQTNEIVIGRNALGLGSNSAVIGATTQTAAYIYGLVHAMSGVSAPGATFSGAVNFLSNITAPNLVTSVDGVTGAVDLLAGSGISITLPTGAAKGITLANTGVVGITGTANQVSVSATTGSVTLSLPSAITTPGSLATTTSLSVGTDLTVTGNLTVNGTTTTVNSNTVTIQDPVIAIGGAGTTNAPPPSGDTKDRGIVFQWRNGLQSATGFFGHDTSTGYFTYIPTFATVTNDVIGGCAGTAQFANVYGPSGVTFTIAALDTESAVIRARGGSNYSNTTITLEAANVNIGNGTNKSGIRFLDGSRRHTIFPSFPASDNRTYDLPDHSGTFVVPSDLGSFAGYILTSQGATAQPVWIKPDDVGTGITASAAKLVTVSSSTDTTSFLTFIDTASNSNQAIRYNSSLAYNATTNYLDVNIDCGTY